MRSLRRPLLLLAKLGLWLGALGALALGLLYAALHSNQEAPSRALGAFLDNRQPPRPADIIYVLGGDYLTRVPYAASLLQEGYGPLIVIPREDMPSPGQPGPFAQEHFTDASLRILAEHGVSRAAMMELRTPGGVSSTSSEIRALARLVAALGNVRSVLIVTSPYHCRRVSYTAARMLPGEVDVQVAAAELPRWNLQNWWLDPVGRSTVREEYLKLIYYWFRFVLG